MSELNINGAVYSDQEDGNIVNFLECVFNESEAAEAAALDPTVQVMSITGL